MEERRRNLIFNSRCLDCKNNTAKKVKTSLREKEANPIDFHSWKQMKHSRTVGLGTGKIQIEFRWARSCESSPQEKNAISVTNLNSKSLRCSAVITLHRMWVLFMWKFRITVSSCTVDKSFYRCTIAIHKPYLHVTLLLVYDCLSRRKKFSFRQVRIFRFHWESFSWWKFWCWLSALALGWSNRID